MFENKPQTSVEHRHAKKSHILHKMLNEGFHMEKNSQNWYIIESYFKQLSQLAMERNTSSSFVQPGFGSNSTAFQLHHQEEVKQQAPLLLRTIVDEDLRFSYPLPQVPLFLHPTMPVVQKTNYFQAPPPPPLPMVQPTKTRVFSLNEKHLTLPAISAVEIGDQLESQELEMKKANLKRSIQDVEAAAYFAASKKFKPIQVAPQPQKANPSQLIASVITPAPVTVKSRNKTRKRKAPGPQPRILRNNFPEGKTFSETNDCSFYVHLTGKLARLHKVRWLIAIGMKKTHIAKMINRSTNESVNNDIKICQDFDKKSYINAIAVDSSTLALEIIEGKVIPDYSMNPFKFGKRCKEISEAWKIKMQQQKEAKAEQYEEVEEEEYYKEPQEIDMSENAFLNLIQTCDDLENSLLTM